MDKNELDGYPWGYKAPWERERTEGDVDALMQKFKWMSREDAEVCPLMLLYVLPNEPLPLTNVESQIGEEVEAYLARDKAFQEVEKYEKEKLKNKNILYVLWLILIITFLSIPFFLICTC